MSYSLCIYPFLLLQALRAAAAADGDPDAYDSEDNIDGVSIPEPEVEPNSVESRGASVPSPPDSLPLLGGEQIDSCSRALMKDLDKELKAAEASKPTASG